MPNGNIMVFGFKARNFKKILGIDMPKQDRYGSCNETMLTIPKIKEINKKLIVAYENSLKDLGFTFKKNKDKSYDVKTKYGKREMYPFGFANFYDEEYGGKFEHSVFGVALSSRYSPTFLDWRDPAGTLEEFGFRNSELKIALINIKKEIPEFKKARLYCITLFY